MGKMIMMLVMIAVHEPNTITVVANPDCNSKLLVSKLVIIHGFEPHP